MMMPKSGMFILCKLNTTYTCIWTTRTAATGTSESEWVCEQYSTASGIQVRENSNTHSRRNVQKTNAIIANHWVNFENTYDKMWLTSGFAHD